MMNIAQLVTEAKEQGLTHVRFAAAPYFDGQVLLMRSNHSEKFEFPGEHYQDGESVNQLLQKALVLHTGLALKQVESYLGHFDEGNQREHTYLVQVHDPFSVASMDYGGYAWVSLQEAIGYPISDEVRRVCDRILEMKMPH